MTRALIVGCCGLELTQEERAFMRRIKPLGLILFQRNIRDAIQVKTLISDFLAQVEQDWAMILIDQEGGRVQRLTPPHWPLYPPGASFRQLPGDRHAQGRVLVETTRRMGADLRMLGITVNCLPVLDVPTPEGHDIIGDRAYDHDPEVVAQFGRLAADALLAEKVLPVIKHIPGHGRAQVDSHKALPIVNTPYALLQKTDFLPFQALCDLPLAMTAHVVYTALDPKHPATTSRFVIEEVIRREIGFGGLLMSDDLSMEALNGSLSDRAHASFEAGCDVVLHCNGNMDEMRMVADVAPLLVGQARSCADKAQSLLK